MSVAGFEPEPSLLPGLAHPNCRAIVIVPARNEEASLAATLDALAGQVGRSGRPLSRDSFEILLLLNNCTDSSATVARSWQAAHPAVHLHIVERTLPPQQAHVGTARRLLMDTAWHRLAQATRPATAILSTDSDTVVAPDWIARNLHALAAGADAVGGRIQLKPGELEALPTGVRRAYRRDRRYQRLVAELEDLLDPQDGDPWPRHLEHFGASLACTPRAYARAGGLPPVKPLEDAAFVDALRRVDVRLRHDPAVVVYTSARLDGRAEVGLSGHLRHWQKMCDDGAPHTVPSAAWLVHRFQSLGHLRRIRRGLAEKTPPHGISPEKWPPAWRDSIAEALRQQNGVASFLSAIDCDRLIEETFDGEGKGEIGRVLRDLEGVVERLRPTRAACVQV
jgi:GT2 family glycosyltransferase